MPWRQVACLRSESILAVVYTLEVSLGFDLTPSTPISLSCSCQEVQAALTVLCNTSRLTKLKSDTAQTTDHTLAEIIMKKYRTNIHVGSANCLWVKVVPM